ncbi:MAG: class I SAM-dependent methyltransferase [Gammaproteobacteria bacterium]
MNLNEIENKWNRIYRQANHVQYAPAGVLTDHDFLLPNAGRALDIACGLGSNALFLSRRGLAVEAWDISETAIEKLNAVAKTEGLTLNAQVKNIEKTVFKDCGFDVIVVSRYLDRTICRDIAAALNPGGLLFYQTYTREKTAALGPNNPDYLLDVNEMLDLFQDLRVVFYREYGLIGNSGEGLRNEAQFIGQQERSTR